MRASTMETFISDGVEIAYVDYAPSGPGRGAPVLLIHGFGSTHAVNWLFPQWIRTLTESGRRVVAFDNRGHGQSGKPYDPTQYSLEKMAGDACALLDRLSIPQADVMGYSMGARIAIVLAVSAPERVRALILGGVGRHMLAEQGLPDGLAQAMEAERIEDVGPPTMKIFRAFAESTRSDLRALAACARGFRQPMTPELLGRVAQPTLICVGGRDDVAGDPHPLAEFFRDVEIIDIPGRDHNRTVGDRLYREAALRFLDAQDATVLHG
jgi:pimeloyl-ACP methyl ester carboxylesterase